MGTLLVLTLIFSSNEGCDSAAAPASGPAPRASARAEQAFDRYRRPDLLIAALGLRGGERVADVGAGRGYLTIPLAAAVGAQGRVVATDIDGPALAALRSRAIGAGEAAWAPIEIRQVGSDDSGLGEERYDLILLCEVDQLLTDRATYLRRLRPNLAPGGRLAVCNRRNSRTAVIDAAKAAGLVERGEYSGLPAHFLLFFGELS